jgi:hypothetical protein
MLIPYAAEFRNLAAARLLRFVRGAAGIRRHSVVGEVVLPDWQVGKLLP